MRHLIERGARRIALIGGEDLLPQVAARRRGALTAAADLRGVELEYLASSEMSILAGRSLADELVTRRGPKPDAILAMNDLLAIGALQALVMNHRLDVPGSLMLTGYDDIDFCSNAVVPITSVRQPSFELGKRALELLEKEIVEGEEHGHVAVVLKPELVTRQSTQRAGRN